MPHSLQTHNAISALNLIQLVARKELSLFFSSPIAWLFLACFAAVKLFVFFWVEAFFARNIADVRPLFSWMPLLLLFLTSALTMKVWSEERRSGTLEAVMTQGSPLWQFVLGKFVGCFTLVLLALFLTLPIPFTVAWFADLDWGPVFAGYLASMLLGSCYLAIGLFVSARCNNQIVSLLLSIMLCSVFYLIGHSTITSLVSQPLAGYLSLIGTGARFDAITRGVIDLRDLYYYISLWCCFLALNTYVLERERFASSTTTRTIRWKSLTALVIANLLLVNTWLGQLPKLRYDATAGQQFSLSDASIRQLQSLDEPLLIRGYFSGQTHPLLAPLIPQLQDLLKEYEIAGGPKVNVEWVDPTQDPAMEQEANQRFNIQPVPFQVADRYQSAIVSSYFNLLVQYGSEFQILGFQDLIEVKAQGETDVEVLLRNPELDITKAVKKVQQNYSSGHELFSTLSQPVTLQLYFSPDKKLPEQLKPFAAEIEKAAMALMQNSAGKLQVKRTDPDSDTTLLQQLQQQHGLSPVKLDPFSEESFWFSLMLEQASTHGDLQQQLVVLENLTNGTIERQLKTAIGRLSGQTGKTIALVTPVAAEQSFGYQSHNFQQVSQLFAETAKVEVEQLSDGQVNSQADVLVMLAPEGLSDRELFAVDQFLMQGGTVIAATSPFKADLTHRSLTLQSYQSGLTDWLQHFGLTQPKELVLDPQHAALPVPITRQVGGFSFQDMRLLDYPWFADVRSEGMSSSPIFSQIPQIVVPWASPIEISAQTDIQITPLLISSEGSWLTEDTQIMPTIDENGAIRLPSGPVAGSQTLAVIAEGQFNSFFATKAPPLAVTDSEPEKNATSSTESSTDNMGATPAAASQPLLSRSAHGARLIVFSSNDLFSDDVSQLVGSAQGSHFLNNWQLLANTVDWATADPALLEIRARGQFNRTLPPLSVQQQQVVEYLNYAVVLALILLIALARQFLHRRRMLHLYQVVTN